MSDQIRFVTLLESDLPKFVMSGSLSSKTQYSVHVHGPLGKRELRNLISLVEAQIAALDDEPSEGPHD